MPKAVVSSTQRSAKPSPAPQPRTALTRHEPAAVETAASESTPFSQQAMPNSSQQILAWQRTVGNKTVGRMLQRSTGALVVQRSVESDRLATIWDSGEKDEFFYELERLPASDYDVINFVEENLTGADLFRARQILGTEQPLSSVQRGALLTLLSSRLATAETRFSAACQQVHEAIQAEIA
ncbi:MAG: hypothetical protein ACYC6L_09700, partial [Anaerolineae bacterium]